MNKKANSRVLQQERRKRANTLKNPKTGFLSIIILSIVGYMIWVAVRPAEGESIEIHLAEHVAEGEPLDPHTDPPTSGAHYSSPMPAGFYHEDSPELDYPYPDGYIIHSLEHGYSVFWYNCEIVSETECLDLKFEIQAVMDKFSNVKVIAFPRASINYPVVMTSWGQMLEMEEFNTGDAERFIKVNRPKAPEPNAP